MAKELIYSLEDDSHIQQLLKYNLEVSGFRVTCFETGEALLKECAATTPDLFIVDIMLPGMDGLEVCKQLRQNSKSKTIPIITSLASRVTSHRNNAS
jgi:two-component system alkaline phosphatase synthesis response regulator PhoP